MKKLCAVFLLLCITLSLMGCGKTKISGSFMNQRTEERYEFLITDSGRGDYGGELNIYAADGKTYEVHSWYVEDSIIYVDGEEEFGYNEKCIYGLYTLDWITVENGNKLTGQNESWGRSSLGGMMFAGITELDRWCYYIESSYLLGNYVPHMVEGTYTVEDSFVRIYDKSGNLDYIYIIVDNKVHNTVLLPV